MLTQRVFVNISSRLNNRALHNNGVVCIGKTNQSKSLKLQVTSISQGKLHSGHPPISNRLSKLHDIHRIRASASKLHTSCRWQSQQHTNNQDNQLNTNTSKRKSYPLKPYVDPKLSYAYGRSIDELVYSTTSRELARIVEETGGEQVCFVSDYEGITKTLLEFQHDIDTFAKSLLTKFNLEKGDSVGIYSYNSYNWLVGQFACARAGMVLVPINPSYKAEELAFVLQSARVKCLLTNGPKSIQRDLNEHLKLLQSKLVVDKMGTGEIQLRHIILMDGNDSRTSYDNNLLQSTTKDSSSLFVHQDCKLHNWHDCMQGGRIFANVDAILKAGLDKDKEMIIDLNHVSPDDLFAIYYTSGTTGTPKGACVSHFATLNNAMICTRRLGHGYPDGWIPQMATVLPFFHIFAGCLNAFVTHITKSLIVLPSYKYDLEAIIKSIIKHQTDVISMTPTILTDMLRYVKEKDIGLQMPIKMVQSGGAALPPELVKRSFEVLPNLEQVRIGYGSTENAAVSTIQTLLEPVETRTISVGPPVDFSEVRVVSLNDDNQLVELGEKGEVQTRGHNTMRGYLDDPDKTRGVLTPTRWYKTGDIGMMHPNGSLQIVGRLKSMIIRGGENIYPDEVERFIYKLPFVDTVFVIGIPDKRMGEEVCAWIKLKPGFCEATNETTTTTTTSSDKQVSKQEVIKFCSDNMTYFKVPKHIFFVDSFPMTPTKKAQAHVMSQMTLKMLGLDHE